MGFLELLTLLFIVLKLIGVISWSWCLVLLPTIITIVFYVSMFGIAIVVVERENRKFNKELDEFFNK